MDNYIINLNKYPRVFNARTPFWQDLHNHYSNPRGVNRAEYNLICSKRDVGLWTKIGMKPTAGWKVSYVKKYFNIKGTKESLHADFMEVWDEYQSLKAEIHKGIEADLTIELTV